MNATRTMLLTCSLLTLVPAAPTWGQQLDSIQGSRAASEFGTMMEMSPTEITFDVRGQKKKYPVNEIRKLTFGDEPRELRLARDAILRNQFEQARDDLAKLTTEGISRKEVRQDIEYYKAFCDAQLALAGNGDKAAAVRTLRGFIESPDNSNTYHYYEGVELLGNLAVMLNSYDNAVKYYDSLADAPWPEAKLQATQLQARALAAGQRHGEALAKYESVLAMSVDSPRTAEQMLFATIGKAACLAETGKPEEGIAILEKVIAENDSQANSKLFGRAYNALGTCHLKLNQPQDALLAFLHTHLLFPGEPETHAESLYQLSRLWNTLNQSDRAISARGLLQRSYAGTSWAQRN